MIERHRVRGNAGRFAGAAIFQRGGLACVVAIGCGDIDLAADLVGIGKDFHALLTEQFAGQIGRFGLHHRKQLLRQVIDRSAQIGIQLIGKRIEPQPDLPRARHVDMDLIHQATRGEP